MLLIFELNINQGLSVNDFERELSSMGIHILSVAENKKGSWVVFSDDTNLKKFQKKLATYGSKDGAKYDFFHAIESFNDIPVEKKLGENLKQNPLKEAAEFVDIELWKLVDPQENENFIEKLKEKYSDLRQFRLTDKLITKSFVLLRVKLIKGVLNEIIKLKEIARIERPITPQFKSFETKSPNIQEMQFFAPNDNATGILIIDSGIISNHPMLEKCVGGEENFQTGEPEIQDTVGHGTAVAGCAIYGNIENSLKNKIFTPSNWLFSAKVMYAEEGLHDYQAVYDPEKLLEHQFKNAVESFLSNPEYHIKVINISLGNTNEIWHKHYNRQLPLAALIDELAFTFPSVVFIVSTGNQSLWQNYDPISKAVDNYPHYLMEEDSNIINPATAALALTVGSIADKEKIEYERYGTEYIKIPIAKADQPSPFTRTGLGVNGMIKPELVEYGGNVIISEQYGRIYEDIGGKLAVLNNQISNPIISFNTGSSFSAPKLAHIAGLIANKFPDKSANFIKNMLLIGADYPFLPDKDFYNNKDKKKAEQLHLSICGYGLSQYDRAVHSFNNRTVLWDEGLIGLNQVKVYSLQLPELFFTEKGRKKITIALTFTPDTRATRGDSYLGNRMEFHLFHSVNPEILIEKYGIIDEQIITTGVPDDLKQFEIDLFPGGNTRKAGCHQKAWKIYKREPKKRPKPPLSLVLLNINKWINNTKYQQDFCISVIFEHEKDINIYNKIKTNIQIRARVKG